MIIRHIIRTIKESAEPLYGLHEAESIARMVVCESFNYNLSQLVAHYDEDGEIANLDKIIAEISSGRPIQYILGKAEFCEMEFEVAEGVLIPRPETEELVYHIVETTKRGARILDIGTGSGAIAISLAKLIKGAEVVAVDISEEALKIAKRNAEKIGANVEFVKADALGDLSHLGRFDIIVSNPPYIPESDRALMRPNVTEHEPDVALFVEDDDPLIFYRAIAQTARKVLKKEGRIYFEIYESLVDKMVAMLECEGYADIVVREDFRGKPRMICARVSSIAR